jgi:predicted nucleic acid-binding protein
LATADLDEAWRRLDEHVALGLLRSHDIPTSVFRQAAQLSRESPVFLRTADAIHLGMALRLNADLATYDVTLRNAAQAKRVRVLPISVPHEP